MKRRAQPWLGTLVEVTIADTLSDAGMACAFDAVFAQVAQMHRLMSYHANDSDVSRINRAASGELVTVSAHTAQVVRTALALRAATAGLFDICCAAKLVEWGYLPAAGDDVPAYLPGGMDLVVEENHRIRKIGKSWIDLGGIAKGYTVDVAIAALQEQGITSACVNAGGDLRVFGDIAYPVLIRDPKSPGRIGRRIGLKNAAMATSGSYFSEKRWHGETCSALVDSRSGAPIVNHVSASVQAPSCMLADALTKVVLASADPEHPALREFHATAFII
ncbi:FAD:protein FMN transferase [Herbaspirillum sp.]|uniref:FAD:protein FMN transferase n=1 Tax=Herbaspirillum sp. TaxID=1890675 RepID=UPI0031DBB5DF